MIITYEGNIYGFIIPTYVFNCIYISFDFFRDFETIFQPVTMPRTYIYTYSTYILCMTRIYAWICKWEFSYRKAPLAQKVLATGLGSAHKVAAPSTC